MTINHLDQLAQWYADAEQITKTNLPNKGDTLIAPYEAGGFGIEVEEDGWTPDIVMPGEPVRILARAPKPKPAWHDAIAVIADTDNCAPQVWERESDGTYSGSSGDVADGYELRNVTPLIEAKVTDEMVERGAQATTPAGVRYLRPYEVREVLNAALGIEAE